MFTVYRPGSITFNPDTGATDILIRQQDSTVLTDLVYYTNAEPAPAFHVANHTSIYPTSVGCLHIPNTDIHLTAYVFPDDDLADNLFGLVPLLKQPWLHGHIHTKRLLCLRPCSVRPSHHSLWNEITVRQRMAVLSAQAPPAPRPPSDSPRNPR